MADQTAPRRRLVVALLPLAIFLVLAAIFMRQLMAGGATHDIPSALIGKPAPQFSLPALEGLKDAAGNAVLGLSTADLAGKVSVVNVWASWCAPCRQEHPLLMELARRDGIRVFGIDYKDEPENALRFLGQLGNPFAAIGVDDNGSAAIEWGVYGVPETFVVAADGTIAWKHVGPLTEASVREKLIPAIEKAAGK